MTKLSVMEIPFCDNEIYDSLSMQNRCILLAMYHMWLTNGKCSVPLNRETNAEIGKVISDPDFDYFLLTKRVRSMFQKLYLVSRPKVFTFVFEGDDKVAYTPGIVHGVHDAAKSNKNVSKSNKFVAKQDRFVSKQDKNVSKRDKSVAFRAKNTPKKKDVLVIKTPQHDNFING